MSSVQTHLELDDFDDNPVGAVRPSLRMTEEEFVAWCDDNTHAEWVDGEVIFMPPISGEHDELGGWLHILVRLFVERRSLGKVRGPEFMVRLPKQRRRRVPDLLFIANDHLDRIGPKHVEGAPDLCLEIVSPESQSRDRREKYLEYEKAGVREYWIVDPLSRSLEAYALDEASQLFRPIPIDSDGRILSRVLPGFYLRAAWLFDTRLPDAITILREFGIQP